MMMTPAAYVIQVFGGLGNVAKVCGRAKPSVCHWKDDDGLIPSDAQRLLLIAARERQLPLTADDLILGHEVAAPPASV